MADARKRARRPDARKGRRKKPGAPAAASPEKPALSEEGAGRIELPSSGLASEILAQPEAAAIEPAAASPGAAPDTAPEAPAAEVGPAAQSLSFFAAPAREQRAAAEATEHLATFVLDREEYGVDVRQVQEIRRVSEITAVPPGARVRTRRDQPARSDPAGAGPQEKAGARRGGDSAGVADRGGSGAGPGAGAAGGRRLSGSQGPRLPDRATAGRGDRARRGTTSVRSPSSRIG